MPTYTSPSESKKKGNTEPRKEKRRAKLSTSTTSFETLRSPEPARQWFTSNVDDSSESTVSPAAPKLSYSTGTLSIQSNSNKNKLNKSDSSLVQKIISGSTNNNNIVNKRNYKRSPLTMTSSHLHDPITSPQNRNGITETRSINIKSVDHTRVDYMAELLEEDVNSLASDDESSLSDSEHSLSDNGVSKDLLISELLEKVQDSEAKIKGLEQSVAILKKQSKTQTLPTPKGKVRGKTINHSSKAKRGKKSKGRNRESLDTLFEELGRSPPTSDLKRSPSVRELEEQLDIRTIGLEDEPTSDVSTGKIGLVETSRSRSRSFTGNNRNPFQSSLNGSVGTSGSEDGLFAQTFNSSLYIGLNEKNEKGNGLIHNGVVEEDVELVRLLIEQGADMELRDCHSNTPLLLAVHRRIPAIADLLIELGADVNVKDDAHNTPLLLACSLNLIDVVQKLILYGADINQSAATGNTPLMLCCHNRYTDIVSVLLGRGADVNAKNRYGDTPLLWCSGAGYCELVILLIDRGADVNVRDRNGNTPLHKASSTGNKEVVEILIEKGADLRIKNDNGQVALDVSTTPQIRKLLEDYDPGVKSWKWEIDYSLLRIDSMPIGEGKFSICYRGVLHGTPVAVKKLKVQTLSQSVIQSFNHEVGLMSDIKHPNCVLFLGACQKPELCIITEYLSMGSLRTFLDRNTIRWSQLLKFAITTARGMAWLHSRRPNILHRDLHSNNILVTENLECKVADLGLSQIQGQRNLASAMYKRIIPPEILKGEMFTKKSDVFSYGLILYEILTSKKADTTTIKQIFSTDFWSKYYMEESLNGRSAYVNLIKACTHPSPEKRPLFEDILERLDKLQDKDIEFKREQLIKVATTDIRGEYVD